MSQQSLPLLFSGAMLMVGLLSALFARRSSIAAGKAAEVAQLNYRRGRPRLRLHMRVVASGSGTTWIDWFATGIDDGEYELELDWYNDSQYVFHRREAWLRVEAIAGHESTRELRAFRGYVESLNDSVPEQVKAFEGGTVVIPLKSLPGNVAEAARHYRMSLTLVTEPRSFVYPAATFPVGRHSDSRGPFSFYRDWEWAHYETHCAWTVADSFDEFPRRGRDVSGQSEYHSRARERFERLERKMRMGPRVVIAAKGYRNFPLPEVSMGE